VQPVVSIMSSAAAAAAVATAATATTAVTAAGDDLTGGFPLPSKSKRRSSIYSDNKQKRRSSGSVWSSALSVAMPVGVPGLRRLSAGKRNSRHKYEEEENQAERYSMPRRGSASAGGVGQGAALSTSTDRSKMKLSLKYVGNGYQQYVQDKWLRSTETMRPDRVFEVLEELRESLVFKNATAEEKVLLAHRLRHLSVEDGTYLIREGEESEPALFIIAAGRATISVNKTQADGMLHEVDVKDIKAPDYFGEGRCLTDSKAYASVRAKEDLVAYLLLKTDIDELLSPCTRSMMIRDMHVRKFQKEHLDNLFEVMKSDADGMLLLEKFAREQNMEGNMLFYLDVIAYKSLESGEDESRRHAGRIYDTYLREIRANGRRSSQATIVVPPLQMRAIEQAIWGNDTRPVSPARLPPLMHGSSVSSSCEHESESGPQDTTGSTRVPNEQRAIPFVALPEVFDEILEQSAIPIIRASIMPKFIQSRYFDRYLDIKFPRLEHSMSESRIALPRLGTISGRRRSEYAMTVPGCSPPKHVKRTASDKALQRVNALEASGPELQQPLSRIEPIRKRKGSLAALASWSQYQQQTPPLSAVSAGSSDNVPDVAVHRRLSYRGLDDFPGEDGKWKPTIYHRSSLLSLVGLDLQKSRKSDTQLVQGRGKTVKDEVQRHSVLCSIM
jgi:CRP-like cAMP-binding protein